ncbi:MAG: lipoyl(octanoyl) transferase LipB [Oligoflexales bacterium]|nr:lipoyl(octanoyl) transferase LipB [Oligoflexales bacterium]
MSLEFENLGLISYASCLEIQLQHHRLVVEGRAASRIFLAEHPPVLTLGKHANPAHLLLTRETLQKEQIELIHVDRGGEITAHEKGQLLAYPILDMNALKLRPKNYVQILEESALMLLAEFGLSAERAPGFPGVWVQKKKIAAVGIRIAQRVSYHGLSLNVNNSLKLFQKIVPCGLEGKEVCSLSSCLQRDISITDILPRYTEILRTLISPLSDKFIRNHPTSCMARH